MYIYTCIFGFIFFLAFILKCKDKRSVEGVYLKNLTSFFFIATAAAATFFNPQSLEYGFFIILGGIFGLMGDIYLDQKWIYKNDEEKYLTLGFISFLMGHIFYSAAILDFAKITAKELIIPLLFSSVLTIGNFILAKPMKQDFGKFKFLVGIYAFMLSFVLALAVVAYFKFKTTEYLMFAIGAFLFLISDFILSAQYFAINKDQNTPTRFVLNHTTYYLAQYIIALTPAVFIFYNNI